MRFFNIDLHISVIADIKHILARLGHEVTDWTLSGHAWVMGREPDPVEIINARNWRSIDRAMCDAFFDRYRAELADYDAFIVTHTPCLAMLYERWQKPIIVVASTRYEQPFTRDAARWNAFNDDLRRLHDRGLLIPLANNRYDAAYAHAFTGFAWPVIPSLCEYVDAPARLERPEFVAWGKYPGLFDVPLVRSRHDLGDGPGAPHEAQRRRGGSPIRRPYRWSTLAEYRGVVHAPYNASLMSLFEQYTSAFPLLVPTRSFLRRLYGAHRDEGILSELSFNAVERLPPGSAIPYGGDADPNAYDDVDAVMQWIELADFYDPDGMPHITYFDSSEELAERLVSLDVHAVQAAMRDANQGRRTRVYDAWRSILQRVAAHAI